MIVGAGPAGLFAGYLLARDGYRPLDPRARPRRQGPRRRRPPLRRGRAARPREQLPLRRGGAGTFSDGKLTSRSTGPDVLRVLEILADCHGKPSIVYEHRPHLGSNRLPLVVRTLRRKLEELGGEVRFSCRVEDLDIADGRLRGLMTSSGYIAADVAVLAIGHSARDTYDDAPAPGRAAGGQAVPARRADRAAAGAGQRGALRPIRRATPRWAPPTTTWSARAGGRDLFTFCMCAGGYVMPSVSEPGYFCTNGMSESRHDSPFANSGLVVTIAPERHRQPPPAGRRPLPAAVRAAGVPGGRPIVRRADPVGARLPGRPSEPGHAPEQLPARDDADRSRCDPPARRPRSALSAACRSWTGGSTASSSRTPR